MGGIAVNLIPPKYGSSVFSNVKYALPPTFTDNMKLLFDIQK